MRQGGGKAKGRQFEKEVSKLLSLWLTMQERHDVLIPSVQSGGLATQQYKAKGEVTTTHQSGDLAMSHPAAASFIEYFSVECKTYKSADVLFLMDAKTTLAIDRNSLGVAGWWEQCKDDAVRVNKIPMLIFKQDYRKVMVGVRGSFKRVVDEYWENTDLWTLHFPRVDLWCSPLYYFLHVTDPTILSSLVHEVTLREEA